MKILKVREVKTPSRSYGKPAGIDFYVPEFTKSFLNDLMKCNDSENLEIPKDKSHLILMPFRRILIPSGIKVILDPQTYLQGENKSGIATKKGLDVMASVIDEDYRGEIHLSLANTSYFPVIIKPNEKIMQYIQLRYEMNPIDEIDSEEFLSYGETERSDKGFGSSDHI